LLGRIDLVARSDSESRITTKAKGNAELAAISVAGVHAHRAARTPACGDAGAPEGKRLAAELGVGEGTFENACE